MFQYAFGKKLAKKNGDTLKFDITTYTSGGAKEDTPRTYQLGNFIFPIEIASTKETRFFDIIYTPRVIRSILRRLYPNSEKLTHWIDESNHKEQYDLKLYKPVSFITGFWQNENYFKEIEQEIRKDFGSFTWKMEAKSEEMLQKINSSNSIFVNYRRTDYISNANVKNFHGVPGEDYYANAVKLITQKQKDPHFFVFSDDIEWCQKNVNFGFPTTFVTHEYAGRDYMDYLRLMIACKHFIIPNSTFAWWAAWLNTNPNKIVIAPKKWFTNMADKSTVVPPYWIQI